MSASRIDFSAQFGGRDAAAAVLPHFHALKAASQRLHLEGFPFPTLAFILRVDGEVNCYEISGAGNLEIDPDGEYLSIDIGIRLDDRQDIYGTISSAVLSGIEKIEALKAVNSWGFDSASLRMCLLRLIADYKISLTKGSGEGGRPT